MNAESAAHTGYFNDGIRRIDIVFVLVDDGDEKTDNIKINYLLNILKVGLELELEQGVLKSHGNLIFVKVHAPDAIIQRYGELFKIRKYFKENHAEFINSSNWYLKVFNTIAPCYFKSHEREWVKIVRKQYPGPENYSTLERSDIVYRMLLLLPFGNHENYVGLERLIQNNIILDAYALHDGPYFFVPKQDIANKVNARQILYNNWIGAETILKDQPVSLLHEYFGEKIAFYFAFCEYLNRALLLTSAAGAYFLFIMFEEILDPEGIFKYRGVYYVFCDPDYNKYVYLCPRCRDFNTCPFYRADTVCHETFFKYLLESSQMVKFELIIITWATMFALFWKRREHYLSWLWEHDINGTNILRPGYKVNLKSLRRSQLTGILRSFDTIGSKIIRILQSILLLCIFLAVVCPLTVLWAHFQFKIMQIARDKNLPFHNYSSIIIFAVIYSLVNLILEKAINKLSHIATRFENHKTQDSYEMSLIIKQFGASFASTFSFFYFIAFIKSRLYTYPNDIESWNIIAGLGMMNCSIFTCVDELCILLCVYIVLRKIIITGIPPILRFKTDYNISRSANKNVPCWEREYRLKTVDEQFVIDLFKDVAMQFALSTLFVGAFPLAPLLILIANILGVRYNSWYLLLGCRRPLLCNAVGMKNWRNIILIVVTISALTNVLMMLFNTRVASAELFLWFSTMFQDQWVPFFATNMTTKNYLQKLGPGTPGDAFKAYKGYKPKYCTHRGTFGMYKKKLKPNNYNSRLKDLHLRGLIIMQHFVIVLVIIIVLLIPTYPKDIQETVEIEKRIKNQCYTRRNRKGL